MTNNISWVRCLGENRMGSRKHQYLEVNKRQETSKESSGMGKKTGEFGVHDPDGSTF